MELNTDYHNKFCMCCGKRSVEIWDNIQKQKWADNKREWMGHTQYQDRDYFYDKNTVKHCEGCGVELNAEDIHSQYEFMGMFGMSRASQNIVLGYKCSNCGYEEKF